MEIFDFFGGKSQEQSYEEKMLANFDFDSTCHQRYENSKPVMGLQVCPRYIKIRKNTNGCLGYQLTNGDGYILTATNGDTGQPQFAPKPMRVVKITDTEILLRGYIVSAKTPFGWEEFDLSDYGFSIILNKGVVQKCILYMYDRNIYVEYMKISVSEILLEIASQCNMAHNIGNYSAAERLCRMLYAYVSPHRLGGKVLINLPANNGQCVGLAFVHMAMCYNWGDEDINSVASENAYYCLAKNLIKEHNTFVAPAIFTLMQKCSLLYSK